VADRLLVVDHQDARHACIVGTSPCLIERPGCYPRPVAEDSRGAERA
jgi:hypothetical protein